MTNQHDSSNRGTEQKVAWDHSTHREFVDYYSRESLSEATVQRYSGIKRAVLRAARLAGRPTENLVVADIGCGAGTQSLMWAEAGHEVHGIDVSADLVEISRARAAGKSLSVDLRVASAAELPWPDRSMDVCLVPELLEHVPDWEVCLREVDRVLRPGGLLFVSTTNVLCPLQQEFRLPLFSWYPGPLKRFIVRKTLAGAPWLANFATYPAVNWFSFYSLRTRLAPMGYRCQDRFDLFDAERKNFVVRLVVGAIRRNGLLRWLGHVATPATILVAEKTTDRLLRQSTV